MPIRHRLLAVSVAIMWGLNFTAIHASLEHFPPFFLVALRFLVLAVPTILFIPWPRVPVRWLLGYGVGFGILQFLFLYWGMAAGMPAGLASLVLQASAPFTVILGALFLRERLTALQVMGILIAVGGLAVVGAHRAQVAAVLPFLLTLAGAFGWAIGNICNRAARPRNPLHLALWVSDVPPLPMLAVSLIIEGPSRIGTSLSTAFTPEALPAMVGLAYTVVFGTVVGTGIWTWLMAHHPAGVVAPYSLLVPVAGMLSAWLVLDETISGPEVLGGAIVVAGVLLGSLRLRPRGQPPAVSLEPLPEPVPVPAQTRSHEPVPEHS